MSKVKKKLVSPRKSRDSIGNPSKRKQLGRDLEKV